MEQVYIVGAGMIKFAKLPEKSMKQMAMEAMAALLKDVSVKTDDIDAAFFGNSGWGMQVDPDQGMPVGQHCIRGEVALLPCGIQGIPIMNVENACASGSNAVHGAFMSIRAGMYDLVLAMEEHPIRYFVKNALFTLRVHRNGTQAPVKKRAPAD